MISTHTRQSVPMATLRERGAIFTPVGTDGLYSVEFPARNGVGPISGTWVIEASDVMEENGFLTGNVGGSVHKG